MYEDSYIDAAYEDRTAYDDYGFGPYDGPTPYDDYEDDDGYTDAEADADTLASAGWGTDEDYGYYGGGDDW